MSDTLTSRAPQSAAAKMDSMLLALLILLMTTNLIAALLILPALLVLMRPRFLTRYERRAPEAGERVAAQSAS